MKQWPDLLCGVIQKDHLCLDDWRKVTCKRCLKRMSKAQYGSKLQIEIDTGIQPAEEK